VSKNSIFADWFVIDVSEGDAFSSGAISFQSKDPLQQNGDQQYKFDGREYAKFPKTLATNFLAPNNDHTTELLLFTLDGTTGDGDAEVEFGYVFYNDDELKRDGEFLFDCFTVVELDDDIDPRFDEDFLGSYVGHLVMTPRVADVGFQSHEATGSGGNDGLRRSPFHGWIVESFGPNADLFEDLTDGQGNPGQYSDQTVSSPATQARTLQQSISDHDPLPGDVVNLMANEAN
jgi:hypothetical protein